MDKRTTGVSLPGHYWYTDPQTGRCELVDVRRSFGGTLQAVFSRDGCPVVVAISDCKGSFQGPVTKPLDE
jgi:hypothetical protein